MVDFIDKLGLQSGTPLNRANLMAIQGFEAITLTKPNANTWVETNSTGDVLTTTYNDDGTITKKYVGNSSNKTITQTVTLTAKGTTEIIYTSTLG